MEKTEKKTEKNGVIHIYEAVLMVEEWFETKIKNSPASLDTKIFNYLHTAKGLLIDSIKDRGASENGTI